MAQGKENFKELLLKDTKLFKEILTEVTTQMKAC